MFSSNFYVPFAGHQTRVALPIKMTNSSPGCEKRLVINNESYYQVCFAVYHASYCCRVSIQHLTLSAKVHPIITSLMRFHIYFTVRQLIRRMQGQEKMSTISREFSVGEFYRNIEHILRNMIYRTRGGVVYQLFPSSLQSDYKRYIPVTMSIGNFV